jgi:hypothetical protein
MDMPPVRRFPRARGRIAALVLSLLLPALGPRNAAQSASSAAPVQLNLKGAGQAKYTIDVGNVAKDEIDLRVTVDFQFVPQDLALSGNSIVSERSSITGRFDIRGSATRLSSDGLFRNENPFGRIQEVTAAPSFPVEIVFKQDSNLEKLRLDLTSPLTPFVYRLDFAPGVSASTIWIRLPSPFVYPDDIESNPLTLTAESQNAFSLLLSSGMGLAHGIHRSGGVQAPGDWRTPGRCRAEAGSFPLRRICRGLEFPLDRLLA